MFEAEKEWLKNEIKLYADQIKNLESERDHFKQEFEYMGKEKDKFWWMCQELEDKLQQFKKLWGDLSKLKTMVGDCIKRIKKSNDSTSS